MEKLVRPGWPDGSSIQTIRGHSRISISSSSRSSWPRNPWCSLLLKECSGASIHPVLVRTYTLAGVGYFLASLSSPSASSSSQSSGKSKLLLHTADSPALCEAITVYFLLPHPLPIPLVAITSMNYCYCSSVCPNCGYCFCPQICHCPCVAWWYWY